MADYYPDKFFRHQGVIHADEKLKKKLMSYYTATPIVDFINRGVISFLEPDTDYKVLDFAMGTGIFLDDFIKKTNWDLSRYYGFELDEPTFNIAKENLPAANLHNINTLTKEAFDLFAGDNLIIIGNPPYSTYSANKDPFMGSLLNKYRFVDGVSINERQYRITDDYLQFICFAHSKISQAKKGIIGIICNHSILDAVTLRGVRAGLIESFNKIYVVNLHGNVRKTEICSDGSKDENVFNIMQGTCILLLVKDGSDNFGEVYYKSLQGLKDYKFKWLIKNEITSI